MTAPGPVEVWVLAARPKTLPAALAPVLVGTAVAFIISFQNNASYDRVWEARKIWGGIVNTSRTLGIVINDFITGETINVDGGRHLR